MPLLTAGPQLLHLLSQGFVTATSNPSEDVSHRLAPQQGVSARPALVGMSRPCGRGWLGRGWLVRG